MSVVARFSVPAEQFALGTVLAVRPEVRIRLETVIPTGDDRIPYFWVGSDVAADVEAALRESPLPEAVRVLDEIDDETLFRVEWTGEVNGILDALRASDAVVLEGTGQGDTWQFCVRFPEHEALSSFYRTCNDSDISLELNEVNNPETSETGGRFGLTRDQHEAMLAALERGYFEVPRGTTLVELADDLGISDSAVSQRLRRGLTSLISATLLRDHPGDRN